MTKNPFLTIYSSLLGDGKLKLKTMIIFKTRKRSNKNTKILNTWQNHWESLGKNQKWKCQFLQLYPKFFVFVLAY
jgi:hypothetical protein